jgi:hypothetical protein
VSNRVMIVDVELEVDDVERSGRSLFYDTAPVFAKED